jgi:hypothetical protein
VIGGKAQGESGKCVAHRAAGWLVSVKMHKHDFMRDERRQFITERKISAGMA